MIICYKCLLQVDTHIHAASSMNQKHLLRFMKSKLKKHGNDKVTKKNGIEKTLSQVSLHLIGLSTEGVQ